MTLIEFLHDESGNSAVEYCIIASLIAITIYAAMALMGDAVRSRYDLIEANMPGQPPPQMM